MIGGITMLIAFQTVLLIIILVSFIGVVSEKEDVDLRQFLGVICIISMVLGFAVFLW